MARKKARIRRKVVVGHDADGKAVVKWVGGYTVKEVEAKKQELIRTYILGAGEAQRNVLVSVYMQEWYDAYKKGEISASTKRSYANAINNHIAPYIGDKQMRAVTDIDLQKVVNRLAKKSNTLIGDTYNILKNVFAHAYAHGSIDRNPAVSLVRPKATKNERRALTPEETAAAMSVIETHEHGLLLALLYYAGLRRGEALGLRWEDVNFSSRTLHVRRDIDYVTNNPGELKSKAANRRIPIPDKLYDMLYPRRGLPSVYVIQSPQGGSYLPQSTYKRWWDQLMVAMYAADPTIESKLLRTVKTKKGGTRDVFSSVLTPHFFRHNYASVLYDAGVDVLAAQKILGHSDPSTTLSIYTHLSEAKADANAKKVLAAFSRA